MKPGIVFVINYFYPDYASTGQLMTELCLHLQRDFDITVIAARPENGTAGPEGGKRIAESRLEGIKILHIKLPKVDKTNKISRLRYVAAYFFYAVYLLLRQKRPQLIYTISQPPILGGLIGSIGKAFKRSKHIYNIQDFNPEQAESIGFMKNRILFAAARWLDTLNCRYADHIITVGQDMKETLIGRLRRETNHYSVINNWTNEQDIVPLPKDHPGVAALIRRHGWEGKFIVMYSGNLGLYYDLENLIAITPAFRHCKDLLFVFIGDGAVKKRMVDYVQKNGMEEQVRFLPFLPKEELKHSLNAADLHLVVNQKGIKGVSVPSKIYGVMAAGKPILGVLEQGSEAERLIHESGCGVVVEPQDYEAVKRRLGELYRTDRDRLRLLGLQGRSYLEKHLRRDISLEKYRNLLLSLQK